MEISRPYQKASDIPPPAPNGSPVRARPAVFLLALLAFVTGLSPLTASAEGTSSLSGRITSAASGDPVAGVCVTALSRTGNYLRETRTDADGAYLLSGLLNGGYKLRFATCYWSGGTTIREQYYPGARSVQEAELVHVAQDESRTGVDAVVTRTGALQGVVNDEDGRPVEGMCVQATTEDGRAAGGAQSAVDGRFQVTDLISGSYKVHLTDCSWQPEYLPEWYPDARAAAEALPVALDAEDAAPTITATVALGRRISGLLTGDDGRPRPWTYVTLHDAASGDAVRSVQSDDSGRYRLTGLPPGQYKLHFADSDYPWGIGLQEWYRDAPSLNEAQVLDVRAVDVTANATLDRLATIRGTIQDGERPLRDMCVTAYGGGTERGAVSGMDGTYAVQVPPGEYRVRAGDCWRGDYGTRWHPAASEESDAALVVAGSGEVVSGVDITLSAGSISGTVRDADGRPLAGICVRSDRFSEETRTDGDGKYLLRVGGHGTFAVYWNDCEHGVYSPAEQTVTIEPGQALADVDVTMSRPATIEGTVTGAGLPLRDVCVEASLETGWAHGYGSTRADGRFSFTVPEAGTYVIRYTGCGGDLYEQVEKRITVALGKTHTADAALVHRPAITGTVRDSSQVGLADICISASSNDGYGSGYGRTRSDGTYSFRVERAAAYQLYFRDCNADRYEPANASVTVASAGSATVDKVLYRPTTLTGRIVDSNGQPIAEACVQANPGGSAPTDATGQYTLRGLPPGSYRLQFTDCSSPGGRYLPKWHEDARTFSTAKVVTLAPEQELSLRTTTLAKAGRVTGKVTDVTTGLPLAQACVNAHDRYGRHISSGVTTADGTYSVGGLATGYYRIQFDSCWSSDYTPQWYSNASSLSAARSLYVTAGATRSDVNAALKAKARMAGTVTDDGGDGIAGICVTGRSTSGTELSLGVTDVNGDYDSPTVNAESYRIRFDDCSTPKEFATEWYGDAPTSSTATVVTLRPGQTAVGVDTQLAWLPTIHVTSPNGLEEWQIGTPQQVTWDSRGAVGATVRIELYRGSTRTSTLAASVPATQGAFTWMPALTLAPGSGYSVRVASTTVTAAHDSSDESFILTPPPPPQIVVTSPNGSEQWQAGSTQIVTWNYGGAVGSAVKLDLLRNGTLVTTLSFSSLVGSNGSGSRAWTLPSTLPTGDGYTLRVSSTTAASAKDSSDGSFTVTPPPPPTIQITAPNGGEVVARGISRVITWTYSGETGSSVQVELLRAGALVTTLSSGRAVGSGGTGSMTWTPSTSLSAGPDYTIRVRSTSAPTASDVSDASFAVT